MIRDTEPLDGILDSIRRFVNDHDGKRLRSGAATRPLPEPTCLG